MPEIAETESVTLSKRERAVSPRSGFTGIGKGAGEGTLSRGGYGGRGRGLGRDGDVRTGGAAGDRRQFLDKAELIQNSAHVVAHKPRSDGICICFITGYDLLSCQFHVSHFIRLVSGFDKEFTTDAGGSFMEDIIPTDAEPFDGFTYVGDMPSAPPEPPSDIDSIKSSIETVKSLMNDNLAPLLERNEAIIGPVERNRLFFPIHSFRLLSNTLRHFLFFLFIS